MMRGAWRVAGTVTAAVALLACGEGAAAPAAGPRPDPVPTPVPTPVPLPYATWVEATEGTMPLVLIAPHGGDLTPPELPDRGCAGCETLNDANTQALARTIDSAFAARTGKRPFVVINRLHRRKFDANRDRAEATGGHTPLDPMWELFQGAVDSAKARATRVHARALVLDLHGHAHAVPRLELGYLLSATSLRLADSALAPLVGNSSIARLDSAAVGGDRGAALLRGPRALGTLLVDAGYPAVPSAQDPAPLAGEAYFDGGYNTQRHGSRSAGRVDAIQIECHNAGVRDTGANRAAFANALVTATLAFLSNHYGWSP
ncbi:MAG: hypothetical protein JNL44_10600 [Gemmatimonadetes bacterium]|nr:hypothetical protein [Gemmatimonadota bacterium]